MKFRLPRRRNALKWSAILILFAVVGLYILLPVGLGIAAVVPSKQAVGLPPTGFEAITLTTKDGVHLAGWYTPPANSEAIILLHGAGDSREAVRPYAEMLARQGYGVLALDLRGHGESEGQTNRYGWQGSRDVQAAIAFLEEQEVVERIGGLGLSMGGEVLLAAASECPELEAIVADGGTVRSTGDLLEMPSERPLVRNFFSRVQFLTVQLLTRTEPPPPIADSIAGGRSRFLLVAAGTVPREIAFGELYREKAGERGELWVVRGATHMGAFALDRDAYEGRLNAFFEESLISGD